MGHEGIPQRRFELLETVRCLECGIVSHCAFLIGALLTALLAEIVAKRCPQRALGADQQSLQP